MSLLDLLRSQQENPPPPIDPSLTGDERMAAIQARLPSTLRAALNKPLVARRRESFITMHEPTKDMLKYANICAFRSEPVLILGESGTGKELIAQIMLGNCPLEKFYPVNCAGITDTLFESLIFGHKAGAFTGATQDQKGLLIQAGDGLVFFDELGELPMTQQAKLLRAIQSRKIMPVGAAAETTINCRFVFATNRDLRAMVQAGTFREDLYYRIAALKFTTYPLRERPEDAIIIADDYCINRDLAVPSIPIPDSIIQSRGNVRALQNWLIAINAFGEDYPYTE